MRALGCVCAGHGDLFHFGTFKPSEETERMNLHRLIHAPPLRLLIALFLNGQDAAIVTRGNLE